MTYFLLAEWKMFFLVEYTNLCKYVCGYVSMNVPSTFINFRSLPRRLFKIAVILRGPLLLENITFLLMLLLQD